MGFGDFLKKIINLVVQKSNEFGEEANTHYNHYERLNLDREKLLAKYKKANSSAEKMAIFKIMQDNGWSPNDG